LFWPADTFWQIFINCYLFLLHKRKCFLPAQGRKEVASNFLLLFVAHFRLSGGSEFAQKIIIRNMFCAFDQKLPAQIEMFTPTNMLRYTG